MKDKVQVPVEQIKRVYRGRPGCGCGCRGKYWNDVRNITRVVSRMNASDEVKFVDGIYFVENEREYMWAYTREA